METIKVLFTSRKWNPISYAIRWAIPRTRFSVAHASHCLIEDGDYLIEANMEHGVRRVIRAEALKGLTIVDTVEFSVPDKEAGLAFARLQDGKSYDFKGAFGLALTPDRTWDDDSDWFCFELAAATLQAAGRDPFRSHAHITGTMLGALNP